MHQGAATERGARKKVAKKGDEKLGKNGKEKGLDIIPLKDFEENRQENKKEETMGGDNRILVREQKGSGSYLGNTWAKHFNCRGGTAGTWGGEKKRKPPASIKR